MPIHAITADSSLKDDLHAVTMLTVRACKVAIWADDEQSGTAVMALRTAEKAANTADKDFIDKWSARIQSAFNPLAAPMLVRKVIETQLNVLLELHANFIHDMHAYTGNEDVSRQAFENDKKKYLDELTPLMQAATPAQAPAEAPAAVPAQNFHHYGMAGTIKSAPIHWVGASDPVRWTSATIRAISYWEAAMDLSRAIPCRERTPCLPREESACPACLVSLAVGARLDAARRQAGKDARAAEAAAAEAALQAAYAAEATERAAAEAPGATANLSKSLTIQAIIVKAGFEPCRFSARPGMHGRECLGVRLPNNRALVHLGGVPEPSLDSMGMGIIAYWPHLPPPEPTVTIRPVDDNEEEAS